jgi:hypothetical protein
MKRTISVLLVAACCSISLRAGAQKFDNAGAYLQHVGKEFKQISADMWDYTSAAAHGKGARKVENKRRELLSQINTSMSRIKMMPSYEGSTALRDSVASYLTLNRLVLNQDYAKIVDMEEIAEQSYDNMEAYMLAKEQADNKLTTAGEMLDDEERKFAAEHHITLIETQDKIGRKLAEASRVYKYYNEIYLIFFKSYKQEVFLLEAQKKGDFNAMEQNRAALAQNSTEGKTKLAAIKGYQGDLSVKQACTDLLSFYVTETKKFNDITAFYLEKEKFEKIKASVEAKGQSKTNDDIKQYNETANSYNAALAKYNVINMDMNNNRSRFLTNWNESVDKLFDKYVPKRRG